MGFVYILKTDRGFYIGSTNDLERRMSQHINGYTPSTKKMGSLELIFYQKYSSLKQARNIEARLKRFKRKDYIERIIKDGHIKILPV